MFRLIFLVTVLLLCSACSGARTAYPDVSDKELAAERLKQHRLAALDRIKSKKRSEAKFLKMQGRVNEIGMKILEGGIDICAIIAESESLCVYEFEILDDKEELNAYADGTAIYITPRMMELAKTDEELALILGHEYAHNMMGHINSMRANSLFGGLLGAAVDAVARAKGVSTGSGFQKLGQKAAIINYSPDFEREADYVGLYVTKIAGFDISNAPNFWRKMSEKNQGSIKQVITHPTNPERFVALEKAIKEIKEKEQKGEALIPNVNSGS